MKTRKTWTLRDHPRPLLVRVHKEIQGEVTKQQYLSLIRDRLSWLIGMSHPETLNDLLDSLSMQNTLLNVSWKMTPPEIAEEIVMMNWIETAQSRMKSRIPAIVIPEMMIEDEPDPIVPKGEHVMKLERFVQELLWEWE